MGKPLTTDEWVRRLNDLSREMDALAATLHPSMWSQELNLNRRESNDENSNNRASAGLEAVLQRREDREVVRRAPGTQRQGHHGAGNLDREQDLDVVAQ